MSLLRQPILLLSRSQQVKKLVSTLPVSSGIVTGYVPGETTEAAVGATARLQEQGLHVTLDFLGEDTEDREQAAATVRAYVEVLGALAAAGLDVVDALRGDAPPDAEEMGPTPWLAWQGARDGLFPRGSHGHWRNLPFSRLDDEVVDVLVGLMRLLGLPGEELLRDGPDESHERIDPSPRSIAAFDSLVAEEDAHRWEMER